MGFGYQFKNLVWIPVNSGNIPKNNRLVLVAASGAAGGIVYEFACRDRGEWIYRDGGGRALSVLAWADIPKYTFGDWGAIE